MLKFDLQQENSSIIKVIGVGGGGSNAVNYMYEQGITGVDFIVCNTDAQALDKSPVPTKVQLGSTLTAGRGAGSIPEVGKNAAIESLDDVKALLSTNTNMVFITAGMGGGTGTGAAPVIAKIAKDMGILTVGIVTVPFLFEGRKRTMQANLGLEEMREAVDTLLIIRNDKLRELYGNLSLKQAFGHADEVLCTAAKGIAEVITLTGTVNVDMNDVKTVMKDSGYAIMGSGKASGEGRAIRAIQTALESPLLNDNDIHGANFILLNITFGQDELLMDEVSEITDHIQEQSGMNAEVIWGYGHDTTLGDDICVTVIATGFKGKSVDSLLDAQSAQPVKHVLDKPNVVEVVNKVSKPTEEIKPEEPVAQKPEEPFVKVHHLTDETKPAQSLLFTHDDIPELSSIKLKSEEPAQEESPLSFEFKQSSELLDGSVEATDSLRLNENNTQVTDRPNRTELLARNKDREMRIREFTMKLKSPSGLTEIENEPAYLRRKISLENVQRSDESSMSRFTLSESTDENGEKKTELRDNNPFLDDNVD